MSGVQQPPNGQMSRPRGGPSQIPGGPPPFPGDMNPSASHGDSRPRAAGDPPPMSGEQPVGGASQQPPGGPVAQSPGGPPPLPGDTNRVAAQGGSPPQSVGGPPPLPGAQQPFGGQPGGPVRQAPGGPPPLPGGPNSNPPQSFGGPSQQGPGGQPPQGGQPQGGYHPTMPMAPPPIPGPSPVGVVGVSFTPSGGQVAPQQPAVPVNQGALERDRAMLHSTEHTRTYPCSACGGQLVFDIASQKLRCPSCGNYSEIDAPREPVQARDLGAAMAELRAEQATATGPQVTGDHEIKCQSCGGTTSFVGSLTATKCPYCATPIQRDDVYNAPARLPVDGVVPFRVDEKSARQLVEKWVSGRWFAPTNFKKYKRVGSFTSVYHAYFAYDADTYTWYQGERGIEYTETYRDDDGDLQTITRVQWYPVQGEVANQFADVPVLANDMKDTANRDRIQALEPWPIIEATAYSPEYVAGHLARTYDHDAEESLPEARAEMEREIEHTVLRDIGGDQQRIHQLNSSWNSLAYKHVLLPIWLLTVLYLNQPFNVYINGLTGEVSGQRPWSKIKLAVAITLAVIVAIVLVVLFMKLHGHGATHGTTGYHHVSTSHRRR